MRGWSIPMGRWMGVEIRLHLFFPLLVFVFFGISGVAQWPRGLALFFILVGAVVVRETARLLVAAWLGLRLRAVLLLPFGGLFAYANPESQENSSQGAGQFALALAGPVANLATALFLAAAILGATNGVHLLRGVIWMQVFLGLLHFVPAYPLDFGRLVRTKFARNHGFALASRAAIGLGQALSLAGLLGGMILHNYWLVLAGFFIMIGAQIEDQGVLFQSVVD